jgi:hypothetical protein
LTILIKEFLCPDLSGSYIRLLSADIGSGGDTALDIGAKAGQ